MCKCRGISAAYTHSLQPQKVFLSSPIKISPCVCRKWVIISEGEIGERNNVDVDSWTVLLAKVAQYKKHFTASSSRLYCVTRTFLHCNDIVTGSSLEFNKRQYLDWIPGLCIKPVCIKDTIRTKM